MYQELLRLQRLEKRCAARLQGGPGKNQELSRLYASIRWRRCVLMQINFGAQPTFPNSPKPTECAICGLKRVASHCFSGWENILSCLRSSAAEHLAYQTPVDQEGAGSSPAGGSRLLEVS
jgi:hypothetical protein